MSNPVGIALLTVRQGLRADLSDVGRHFPLAALADRSFEWGKAFFEHAQVSEHVSLIHSAAIAVQHTPRPVVWAVSFASIMLVEAFYHDAADRFYGRVAHHTHKALHVIPGMDKLENLLGTHQEKIKEHVKSHVKRRAAHLKTHVAHAKLHVAKHAEAVGRALQKPYEGLGVS